MSGKFWDMYKGKSSYDSFDSDDHELVEEMGLADDDDDDDVVESRMRQSPEEDQPEDRSGRNVPDSEEGEKKKKLQQEGQTVIIAYKVRRFQLCRLLNKHTLCCCHSPFKISKGLKLYKLFV